MKENKIIIIHSDNKNILINCSKPMSIRTLKKEIAKELKLNEELVVLMNEKKVFEGNDIIDIDEKIGNIVMYIKNDIGEKAYMNSKQNEETIASLIMKVTGAKTQIEQKSVKKVRHHPFSEANELINQIFSHSPLIIPGVSTSSVRVRQELQNFLMPFFQQQPISATNDNQGSQNNQTNNNNASNNMNISIINLAQGNNSENQNNDNANNNQAQQNIRFPFQIIQQGNIAADEEKVKTLMELGFSEESSRKALVYSANDLDAAAELCITGRIDEMPSNANMQTFFFPIIGNNNNQENNESNENNNNNNNAD